MFAAAENVDDMAMYSCIHVLPYVSSHIALVLEFTIICLIFLLFTMICFIFIVK